jgi:hypothetical protein
MHEPMFYRLRFIDPANSRMNSDSGSGYKTSMKTAFKWITKHPVAI